MRSRAVRITLALLAISAIAAAAYHSWTIHSRTRAETHAAATFEQTRIAALREAHEVRSAQQAYVAVGQNETFWSGKVTSSLESLRASLVTLRASTSSAPALSALEDAATALENFEQFDRRARNYAAGGQKFLASDVIFSDGLEAMARITNALERAGFGIAESNGLSRAEGIRGVAIASGAAAGLIIIALLLLTPVVEALPQRATPAIQEHSLGLRLRDDGLERSSTLDNMRLRTGPPSSRATPKTTAAQEIAAPAAPAVAPSPNPPAAIQPAFEIGDLAAVCTDLARLSDTSMLPSILERAATALNASGLVLWLADAEGRTLIPIAAHGYAASVVSRIGSLKAEDGNATSAAFRTGLLQTVAAEGHASGAIAVPLVVPAGCRGVMSAEVRDGAERQPARLAAASIVAAQLATLVGPPAAASSQDRSTAAL